MIIDWQKISTIYFSVQFHISSGIFHSSIAKKAKVLVLIENGTDVNQNVDNFQTSPLHIAAKEGLDEIAEILIQNGAKLNAKDDLNLTPLHYAVIGNHLSTVKILVKNGCDLDSSNNLFQSPLFEAVSRGFLVIAEFLVENGANVEKLDKNGSTLFLEAVKHNHLEIMKMLMANGAKIDVTDNELQTPLHKAVKNSNEEIVKFLIDKGCDANFKDSKGILPIQEAIQYRNYKIVEILIEVDPKNFGKNSLLLSSLSIHEACQNGLKLITEALIKVGTNVNSKDENFLTPLHLATLKNHKEIVQLLLKNGAEIDPKDKFGLTPFLTAVKTNHLEIVKLLFENGANIHELSAENVSALHFAVNHGLEMTRFLLENGVNPNAKSLKGTTVIHKVAAHNSNQTELIQLLIKFGADIEILHDTINWTAINYAVYSGSKENVQVLLDNGAKIHDKSLVAQTSLLFLAVKFNREEIFKMLINYGAVVNKEEGMILLQQACSQGNKNIIEILIEHGVDINAKTSNGGTALHCAVHKNHIKGSKSKKSLNNF